MTSFKIDMEKFDGKNDFNLWREKMIAHLGNLGLDEALKGESKMPSSLSEKEKSDILKKARNTIVLSLSDQILRKVVKEKSAAEMWLKLEQLFMTKTLPNRIYLKQRFYGYRMEETKSIDENIDEFTKLVVDLANLDVEIDDEDQAIFLLNSLPRPYEQLKDTLKYGRETLSLEEVVSAVYSKELDLKTSSKVSKSSAEGLNVRGRPDKRNSNDKGRDKSRSNSRPREIECWYCKKTGHMRRDCNKRKKDLSKKKGKKPAGAENVEANDTANVSEGYDSADVLSISSNDPRDEWVLDSGATFHMTSRKDWLFDLKDTEGSKVLMGDNTPCDVKGIGSVKLKMADGTMKILKDVRYIPELKRNLISLGTLDTSGYEIKLRGGVLKVLKGIMVAMKGTLNQGLYILQGETITGENAISEHKPSPTDLWHRRLGHMSLKGLVELHKQGLLKDIKATELQQCEHCIMGKSHRLKFPKGKHTTKGILDYVHSDLWGSPKVPFSLGKAQYFLSLIDDYSRKVWLYFIRTKDEAFSKFLEWKSLIENQTNRKIKRLRTDNGLEFCNNVFDSYCAENGIFRHRTCIITPQQNGLAERMNRTIMNKVRCMLSESGMPKIFWAEAAATACYVINRSPSVALDFKVPNQIWSDTSPSYDHLKPFGCLAYVHVTQGKLEPRAKKGYFLSYPLGVKGYKVWLMDDKKAIISRDVVFNEYVFYKTNVQVQEQQESSSSTLSDNFSGSQVLEKETESTPSEYQVEDPSVGEAPNQEVEEGPSSNLGGEIDEQGEDSANEDLRDYVLTRDRVRRQIKPPSRFAQADLIAFALNASDVVELDEPLCYREAKRSPDWKNWEKAMIEEMDSLKKNNTWVLVNKPKGKRVIGSKWIYKRKPGIPGVELPRFKARLVAKGYSQVEGVDYHEVFSPVVKHTSIRVILSIAAMFDLELEQLDVKTAFLHGTLDEELYMSQPEGFIKNGEENKVCLLKKSLYGLKQSPRQWYRRFDDFMMQQGFSRSRFDSCVYFTKLKDQSLMYLLIYVDDMLIVSSSKEEIQAMKKQLNAEFSMKDLGAATRILGIDIQRDRKMKILTLSQKSYFEKVLRSFSMENAKATSTPIGAHFKLSTLKEHEVISEAKHMKDVPYSNCVGSLMYAMVSTRPDLAYGVGLVSRFMSKPSRDHWQAAKWLLRYLKGTSEMKLVYSQNATRGPKVVGYCDSDYAADLDKRRSISGYVFTFGGNTVSWKSSLQHVVALSTTEAEYISLTEAIKEGLWLKGFVTELGFNQEKVEIHCDSQSAIHLSKNSVFHERTKHIDVKLHFVRDVIASNQVEVKKISTDVNPADMLTKVIPVSKFEEALNLLNLLDE